MNGLNGTFSNVSKGFCKLMKVINDLLASQSDASAKPPHHRLEATGRSSNKFGGRNKATKRMEQ
jgi:hypothetical protein